jgi:hypothetical protein
VFPRDQCLPTNIPRPRKQRRAHEPRRRVQGSQFSKNKFAGSETYASDWFDHFDEIESGGLGESVVEVEVDDVSRFP